MNGSALPEALPGLAGPNPFVGPRPFELGERLYGREREIGELHFRLNAERIVLLHSPSGAGKSSLVQAGLVPLLAKAFDVWGPTRVNAEPADAGANRYVLSAVHGFEEGVPKAFRRPVQVLAGQTLAGYFEKRPRRRAAPQNVVLLCDQFEEILTVDPLAVEAKHAFFEQLGELLRNPRVWALFALREDYLAPLDPYARQVPTHLKNRFRIDLLGLAAAREAMVEPARQGGREFPAVDELVTDLATMKVQQPDGTFVEETGQHVEPVQLQVVCRRLWDAMPPEDLSIDAEDLERFGDVTEALAAYYADSVARTSGGDPARERAIRDWFGEALITAGGIRGQVLREAEASGGLANDLIDRLRGTHLVRAEKRAGATWYELAHDRLIEPVQRDNAAWRERHLADVQRRAALWERQGRPPGLLLAGAELAEGDRWAAENGARITEVERRFLAESRQAHEIAEQERRQARRIRRLAIAATVVGVLALVACGLAAWQWRQAETQRKEAEDQTTIAKKEKAKAEILGKIAAHESVEAENAKDDAFRQKGIAEQESARARTEELRAQTARFEEHRATARVDVELAEKLIAEGRRREALAYLAQAVRLAPENSVTRGQVFALLVEVGYPIPNDPLRHNEDVYSASFSPDGQRVVTASRDGVARVWDAATGKPLAETVPHDDRVSFASFSPDGRRIVTASFDQTARLWDAATGEWKETLESEFDLASALFSPDGKRVATVSASGVAHLWDLATRDSIGDSLPVGDRFTAFSLDGQRAVTGKGELLDITGRNSPKALAFPNDIASFSPDGQHLLTVYRGTVSLWDARTGELVGQPRANSLADSISFSPDGDRVLIVSDSLRSVALWHLEKKETRSLPHDESVDSASFSPDGQRVVTASAGPYERGGGSYGIVQLWDVEGKKRGPPLRHEGSVNSASFSPDGLRVVTTSLRTVHLWDTATGKPLGEPLRHAAAARAASFSPDGQRVVVFSKKGLLMDASTGEPLSAPLRYEGFVGSVSLSRGGQRVVTLFSHSDTAQLWDAVTGKPIGEPQGNINSASFSPDGKRVVTAGDDATIRFWDAATGKELGTPLRHEPGRLRSASFSLDGQQVVTAHDVTARLWHIATGRELGPPLPHRQMVESAWFSPDGRRVLTISGGLAWLWDPVTRKTVAPLRGHERSIHFASFSPDSQRVVTASDDNTARLWNAATGEPIGSPLRHEVEVYSASFSPDGQRVVTVTRLGAVRVWDVPTASAAEAGLLAEVAEVVGGYSITGLGASELIPFEERTERMAALRRLGERARDHEPTVDSFLRWYFAPRFERTISPLSKMTVAEYIKQLLALGTPEARQEAEEAFPGHPLLTKAQP